MWDFAGDSVGFKSRGYGIIYVKGSYSQSWQTVMHSACEFRNLGYITAWATAISSTDCTDDTCNPGFYNHMVDRCDGYDYVGGVSKATMGLTFVGIMMVAVASLITAMASSKKVGGFAAGLFLFAGLLTGLMNLWWILATDSAFKKMAKSGWFPYPSIGIAWYLHLYGSVTLIVAGGVYAFLVWPEVMNYDEAEVKLQKRIAAKEKRQERKKMQQDQQNQHMMAQQAQQQQMNQWNQQQQVYVQQQVVQQEVYTWPAFDGPRPQPVGAPAGTDQVKVLTPNW